VPGTKKPGRGGDAKAAASLASVRVEAAAYEQFLELTADGVWRYDIKPSVSTKLPERDQAEAILARARLGFCNRAFAQLYGFESPEALVGVPLARLLAGTDEDKIRFVAEAVRAGYRLADVEVMAQNREGAMVWTANNVAGVVRRGRLVCGWGTSRDITDRKAAEKALHEAHADLRATLAAFPDLLFEVDAEGRFNEYRAPNREQLYAPPAAFLGKTVGEVLPPDAARTILDALGQAVQHGAHHGAMYALDLPGGRRWFDLTIAAKGDERGPRARYIVIARDLTTQETALVALRASQERLALALDATSDGLYDVDFRTGETYYSPRYAAMLGYDPDELPPSQETWEGLLHPEDRLQALRLLDACLSGKTDEYEMEFRLRPKAGGWRWILSRGRIVARDAEGRALRLVGTHRDITARRETREVLRRERDLAQRYLDTAEVMVLALDVEGRITLINRKGCMLLECAGADELIGKNWFEACLPPSASEATMKVFRGLMAGEIEPGEYHENPIRTATGSERPIAWHNALLRDASGEIIGTLSSGEDITERVDAARRIERALAGTIHALAVTTEMRDPYTAGHQERVTKLAIAIGGKMGLSESRLEGLRVAGLLHDVGKVSVPAEILSKPSGLTSIEFGLVRAHPETGHAILQEIEFPWPVAAIVLQHHERMDGSGYPRGLRGEEILLEARILAVADTVEAMASHRPYRAAIGIQGALDEVARGRGTVYDEGTVSACIEVFAERLFVFDL
jgi:PAS domain S-box-containing protein